MINTQVPFVLVSVLHIITFGQPSTMINATGYSPTKSVFSPYYFKTNLLSYGSATESCTLEFAASNHGGILKTTFPSYEPYIGSDVVGYQQTRRIQVVLNGGLDHSAVGVSPFDNTAMIRYSRHHLPFH